MPDVEIRELKQHLSEGVEAGWITPGSGGGLGETRRWRARGRVLDALAKDRDED